MLHYPRADYTTYSQTMNINYPTKIAWRRYLQDESFFAHSKSKQKALRNFLDKVEQNNITHEYITPDEPFYNWFEGMYEAMLDKKANALSFNVREYQIMERQLPTPKYALILKNAGTPVGATIFFKCARSYNIAFKTYETSWPHNKKLRIGPSLYSEYLLFKKGLQDNKDFVSLGIDRNPYGPNADIGLATYKLSAGYVPREIKNAEYKDIDASTVTDDTLVFKPSTHKEKFITDAVLIAADPDRYEMLQKQTTLSDLEIISRS